ncbi:MAG: hypothetical protein HY681_09145 [Chloroflexi bacterium]|nr:hypothetical protein [Chloroflexota bacterium]
MPISRRQFELGITPQVEEWMGKLYDFLADHRNQAYSEKELTMSLQVNPSVMETGLLEYALKVLVATDAVDSRIVDGETYYAFQQAVEKGTWRSAVPF